MKNAPRFYLRHSITGLFFRVRLGGIYHYSDRTGGNGFDGAAEGWDTRAEAEQALKSLSSHLRVVEA